MLASGTAVFYLMSCVLISLQCCSGASNRAVHLSLAMQRLEQGMSFKLHGTITLLYTM
jgi:hypothetical protein